MGAGLNCCKDNEEVKKKESSDQKQFQEYQNGDTYCGPLLQGLRTGSGVYNYKNGGKYEGEFLNGELHGMGIFYYKNGEMYKGEW